MQFTITWNNGGTSLVTAKDKYEAIEKAKEKYPNNSGVKKITCNGKEV